MNGVPDERNSESSIEEWYSAFSRYLLGIAYRIMGTWTDAEDIVQETFSSLQANPDFEPGAVRNPKAYLSKLTVNRCLNALKSARRRRETYVGPWLPEPLEGGRDAAPSAVAERAEMMSYAYLVLLERLGPAERAAVVLREALRFEYAEMAEILGKTEASCRQLVSRALRKLGPADRERPLPAAGDRLARRFAAAFAKGDVQELLALLAKDAVMLTDGGGRTKAAINPIAGASRVVALLKAMASRSLRHAELSVANVNGEPGIAAWEEGKLKAVFAFSLAGGGAQPLRAVYAVLNPDKLQAFGRIAGEERRAVAGLPQPGFESRPPAQKE